MSVASSQHAQTDHTLLSIFSLTCLALMIAVPFITSAQNYPIVTFYKEWIAAFFAVLAGLFLLIRTKSFQFPLIAIVPLSLILILGIQITVGKTGYWQAHYLVMLYLGMATILMVLGANLKRAIGLYKIVPVLSWTIVLTALITFSTILLGLTIKGSTHFLAEYILVGRAGNIGQVNHFSNYMALATGSLAYLFLTRKINLAIFLVLASILLLALALAGQRMAILYVLFLAIGGLLLTKIVHQEVIVIRGKILLWLIPIFVIIHFLLPYLTFLNPEMTPFERLANTAGGSSKRLIVIEQAWVLFKQNPVLGAGWHEFTWHNFLQTENYPDLNGLWNHSHNIVLQLMAEMGLVATVLVLVATIYWLIGLRKQPMTLEDWWILVLLGVLGIHSMLEYPLWYTFFLAIAALLLGMGDQNVITRPFRLAPIMFAASFIFGVWSLGNLLFHYQALSTTLTEFREGKVSDAEISDKLTLLNQLRQTSPLTPFIDNVIIRVLPNHPDLVADKLKINSKVAKFWPGKVEIYTQATLLALNDQPEAAQEMMLKAIKQFPSYRKDYLRQIMGPAVRGETRLLPLIVILQESPVKIIQR